MRIFGLTSDGKVAVHAPHDLSAPQFLRRKLWESFDGETNQRAIRAALGECILTGEPQDVMIDNRVLHFERCIVPLSAIGYSQPQPDASALMLTEREAEVIRLLAEGLTPEQICLRLEISRRTLQAHTTSILLKSRSATVPAACAWAVRAGIA